MVLGVIKPGCSVQRFFSVQHKTGEEELVANVSLDGRQVRARARVSRLRVTRWSQTRPDYDIDREAGLRLVSYPIYEFERSDCQSNMSTGRSTPRGTIARIVFDTLLDTLSEEGGTVLCVWWDQWMQISGILGWTRGSDSFKVTSALVVAPVEGQENTYRRRGWLETEDDDLFENAELKDIILI